MIKTLRFRFGRLTLKKFPLYIQCPTCIEQKIHSTLIPLFNNVNVPVRFVLLS